MRSAISISVCMLLATSALVAGTSVKLATTKHSRGLPVGWARLSSAAPDAAISFVIHLERQNLGALDEAFHAVNSPRSPRWGEFLSLKEVRQLVAANPIAIKTVSTWLRDSGVPQSALDIGTDSIHVTEIPVRTASALFGCRFAVFEHVESGNSRIRADGDVLVPASVAAHIDLITGLTELFSARMNAMHYGIRRDKQALERQSDPLIVPSVLRKWYNVQNNNCTNSSNILGIAAFDDNFSYGALRAFERNQSEPFVRIQRVWSRYKPDDEIESDLDVQYSSAMARGAPMQFVGFGTGWVLDFVDKAVTLDPSPLVYSISYGWSELAQCQVTGECATLGYSSIQYVNRTNQGFQMMGTAGISVFVSSGDDGTVSMYGASGNCPLDLSHWCPLGGCLKPSQPPPQCGSLTIITDNNNTKCYFPMGLGSGACQGFLSDSKATDVLNQWISDNAAACNADIVTDIEGNPWIYSSCACSDMANSSHDGYTVTAFGYDESSPAFSPDYPTASPYVVSVGATQFVVNEDGTLSEGLCSITTGAIITTGSGFSAFQPQMPWQADPVQQYLSSTPGLPPTSTFDSTKRAYPDIVANGHNYWISYSPIDKDKCGPAGCKYTTVDGTSASSPAVAGFFTLINDALLNRGLPPLGAVGEALYFAAKEQPSVFNSIADTATTQCNRFACCEWGFPVAPGNNAGVWSAAAGLGSPNVQLMLDYFVEAKLRHKQRQTEA